MQAFLKSNIYTQNIFFSSNAKVETISFEHMLTMQSKVVKMSTVITNNYKCTCQKGWLDEKAAQKHVLAAQSMA